MFLRYINASLKILLLTLCMVPSFVPAVYAQRIIQVQSDQLGSGKYLARIELNTTTELLELLQRAESLGDKHASTSEFEPVVFVLHGPEAKAFLKENYRSNKPVVDLAARLSALNWVRIDVCETWLGGNQLSIEHLQPFVGTVPSGPAETKRLVEEASYQYF